MLNKKLAAKTWLKLIGKENLQNFQDSMARSYNVKLCFQNLQGEPIISWSNMSMLCYTLETEDKNKCQTEHQKAIELLLKAKNEKYIVFTCYAGISNFFFPVYFDNKLIAVLHGGGVVTDKTTIAPEILEKYKVRIMSEEELKKFCEIISNTIKIFNIDCDFLETLEAQGVETNEECFDGKLSRREIEVAKLICQGEANKKIAEKLFISEKTVKSHVSNILAKLDIVDRIHLVIKYGGIRT